MQYPAASPAIQLKQKYEAFSQQKNNPEPNNIKKPFLLQTHRLADFRTFGSLWGQSSRKSEPLLTSPTRISKKLISKNGEFCFVKATLQPHFFPLFFHTRNVGNPIFNIVFVFQFFIQNLNHHLVGGMVFPVGKISDFLITLDGASFTF